MFYVFTHPKSYVSPCKKAQNSYSKQDHLAMLTAQKIFPVAESEKKNEEKMPMWAADYVPWNK